MMVPREISFSFCASISPPGLLNCTDQGLMHDKFSTPSSFLSQSGGVPNCSSDF
jgi:hypothetical protein